LKGVEWEGKDVTLPGPNSREKRGGIGRREGNGWNPGSDMKEGRERLTLLKKGTSICIYTAAAGFSSNKSESEQPGCFPGLPLSVHPLVAPVETLEKGIWNSKNPPLSLYSTVLSDSCKSTVSVYPGYLLD